MDYCKKCGQHVTTTLTHNCQVYNPCPSCSAKDAELTRLRSIVSRVEDVDALEAFLDGDESRSMGELARKLRDYLMGEG